MKGCVCMHVCVLGREAQRENSKKKEREEKGRSNYTQTHTHTHTHTHRGFLRHGTDVSHTEFLCLLFILQITRTGITSSHRWLTGMECVFVCLCVLWDNCLLQYLAVSLPTIHTQ